MIQRQKPLENQPTHSVSPFHNSLDTMVQSKKRPRATLDLAAVDETIDSDDEGEDDYEGKQRNDEPSLTEDEEETEDIEAKRVRMARTFLDNIDKAAPSSSEDEGGSDDESQNERVSRKLQHLRQKQMGTLERNFAHLVTQSVQETIKESDSMNDLVSSGTIQLLRGHDLTPTCVALQEDGTKAASGSKDHSVAWWDIETGKKSWICKQWKRTDKSKDRTEGQVLSLACSDDGRYLAVGARDATVRIFDIRSRTGVHDPNLVKTFEGHKSAVTSVAFRKNSLQMFSASTDRCIRHYNLEEMLYLETFYGHQFGVTDIACYTSERPVSVGQDRTARAWKLAEDSHSIFRGGAKLPNAEAVTIPREGWFITGHENGSLCLWKTDKKKAVASLPGVHGQSGIVCCRSLPGSDIVATGSNNGKLCLFKVRMGDTLAERGLEPAGEIPLTGFVNDLAMGPKARFCVAAIGQEHRLGRWERVRKAKNRIAIIQLQSQTNTEDEDEDDEEEVPAMMKGSSDDDDESGDSDSSSKA